jgi:rhamnosyltransferase
MKRIATYLFHDPKGNAARYKIYYLSQLIKFVDRLVIICNGPLTAKGREEFEQFTEDIVFCDNGSIKAHRAGLKYVGWCKLKKYDEYLMCDDSYYGPITSFDELFYKMDKRECDCWSVTDNFINFKSRLLKSKDFKRFWKQKQETIDFFQRRGYKADNWVDMTKYDGRITNISENLPFELLKDHKMPLLYKKAVSGQLPLSDLWEFGYGDEPYKALEYIDKHTDYDVDLIWKDILRNNHLSDIQERLQLVYIIPDDLLERNYNRNKKIAVICHIYYADLVEECAACSENFPEGTDFYLAATSEETLAEIHREYGKRNLNYTAQIRSNVGFDIPTLCVTYAHVADDYDYVCYFHDKKSLHLSMSEIGRQFKLRCYDNLFGSKRLVQNIINKFEDNPRMGILGPSPPYHSIFVNIENKTWGLNFDKIKKVADILGLDIPLSKDNREPMTAGSMFWFRPDALKKLLTHGFSYDDFAGDDFAGHRDLSLAHAMERIFSLAAQDSGYYFVHAISGTQARCDLSNYMAMLFGNKGMMPMIGQNIAPYDTYRAFMESVKLYVNDMGAMSLDEIIGVVNEEDFLETVSTGLLWKKVIKRITPRFIWRWLNRLKWSRWRK